MTLTLLGIPVISGLSMEAYFILLLIAIPTFFFWQWLLRKYIKTDRKRIIVTWTITLIATPIIYLGLISLLMLGITYTPSKSFIKSEWLTGKERRFQMAGDIISSKMLIGKDTNQVKQILGDPTMGRNSTWRPDTINTWVYDMGMSGGGLGFLFHHLVVKFDKTKVATVEHAEIRD